MLTLKFFLEKIMLTPIFFRKNTMLTRKSTTNYTPASRNPTGVLRFGPS